MLDPITVWSLPAGLALLAMGLAVFFAGVVVQPGSAVREGWDRYEAALQTECRFLFLNTTGARIARVQLAVAVAVLFGSVFMASADLFVLVPLLGLIAISPYVVLRQRHQKRVLKLEEQLDGWLVALANALKSTPSLGEALASTASVIRKPMSEELDLAIKETKLGASLDKAMLSMSERIGSHAIGTALATVLVGRETGGDMVRILSESASTLRELSRLEGVIRTKTAEAKSQTMVLAAVPFFVVLAIQFLEPGWFDPLTESFDGYLVIAVSIGLWGGGILLARKFLDVDF